LKCQKREKKGKMREMPLDFREIVVSYMNVRLFAPAAFPATGV
jgi:hypothetical protein